MSVSLCFTRFCILSLIFIRYYPLYDRLGNDGLLAERLWSTAKGIINKVPEDWEGWHFCGREGGSAIKRDELLGFWVKGWKIGFLLPIFI